MTHSTQTKIPGDRSSRLSGVVKADFSQQKKTAIEIDALVLRSIKRRFMALNQDRLSRVQDTLERRQRIFIELLPLLFHINHPMLPGYLNNKTPCGISDYSPGKRCIKTARKLAMSFTHQRRAQRRYSIHALYMMGSTGTIAYSKASDFDIWICHRPGLAEKDCAALRDKSVGIRSWAESLGLEVHFFLMDDASFRKHKHQQLSNENAGSSQHHLLLDEFYRTGLLIAGRYPVWWLVPAEHEEFYDDYVQKLIVNRFIKASDIVDFGGLHDLPSEEFFGAALWQLYKAVDSPYKSILKILLMEAYANQYPDIEVLAIRFKKLVHHTRAKLDQLDPYVMMCNTVEEYLFSRKELDRLDLARRCFYLKINEQISTSGKHKNNSWQRTAIRELATSWGWSKRKLESLDQRKRWKIQRVMDERNMLVNELTRSYHALSRFSREQPDSAHRIKSTDLNLLGRKLYVAFERKAGKVELVNPCISDDLSEEQLSLHRVDETKQRSWVIYRGNVLVRDAAEHEPMKRTANLLELLAWCHFNGLVNRGACSVSIQPPACDLVQWELRCVLDCLQQLFPNGVLPDSNMQSLAEPACIRQAGLFVNLARDPMAKLSRNGMQLVSGRIDPLSYGGQWENLAVSFELLVVNSWNEVLTFSYSGRTALLDCLCDLCAWSPLSSGNTPPAVPCFSFSSSRGAIIARRVEELFSDISDFFYRSYYHQQARYALRIGQHYYILQVENDSPRYTELDSGNALLDQLGYPQASFSPILFDPQTLDNSPLPLIMRQNMEGIVQLFYRVHGNHAQVYILDERGSLFHQRIAYRDKLSLLGQYQRFLDAIRCRIRNMNLPNDLSVNDDFQYFRITRDGLDQYQLESVQAHGFSDSGTDMDVKVIGDLEDNLNAAFSIFCGNQEYSSLEHGLDVFTHVAEHIATRRKSGRHYPVYISDMDLTPASLGSNSAYGIQSVLFLKHKKRIEKQLNTALRRLSRR